jgi:transcriptional regulator with XRE-family HTH domain
MPKVRPKEFLRRLGDRIRVRRLYLGMTRAGLGTKVGVSGQQLERYECGAGHPPAATLHRIAAALGVSSSSLLGETIKEDRADEIAAMHVALADPLLGGVLRNMLRLPMAQRELLHATTVGLLKQLPETVHKVEVMT